MAIKKLYQRTSWGLIITLYRDDVLADIRTDTVSLIVKKKKWHSDDKAVLTAAGDVITEGEDGKAVFDIPEEDTDLPHGYYHFAFKWESSDETSIPYEEEVYISKNLFD